MCRDRQFESRAPATVIREFIDRLRIVDVDLKAQILQFINQIPQANCPSVLEQDELSPEDQSAAAFTRAIQSTMRECNEGSEQLQLSDAQIDTALESINTLSAWPAVNPLMDELWDEFVNAESSKSGLPIRKLVKPGGNGPILFALNYAPENETAFQDFGVTPDASQPCIRVLASKMGIPCEEKSLLTPGLWIELCFRRFRVPPRSGINREFNNKMPYEVLGEDVLAEHFAFRKAIWATSTNPIALLLGGRSFSWYKANIEATMIPFSNTKIFGEQAALYLEYDAAGNLSRIALPVFHPEAAFYRMKEDSAKLNDLSWNFALACAGITKYDPSYFSYKASLHQSDRDCDIKVNWGALGNDLITFVKATRRYELATNDTVDLKDFPLSILSALEKKKLSLPDIAPGQTPSLVLAKELGRLRVATQEELDWPHLREYNAKAKALGFPNLAKGRESHKEMGYPGLVKGRETRKENNYASLARGRETERANGFPGLAKGRATQAALGFPALARGRETHRENGFPNFLSEENREKCRVARYESGKANDWALQKSALVKAHAAVQAKKEAGNLKVAQHEQQFGGFNKNVRKRNEENDKAALANGVAKEVIEQRKAIRDAGRRAHVIAAERASFVGIGVSKLKVIERTLAKKDGLSIGAWRKKHPLENIDKSLYAMKDM